MSGLEDVKTLTNKVFGSSGTNDDFADLLQGLFKLTVLTRGEKINYKDGVFGNRVGVAPLKLNNGKFLRFYMKRQEGYDDLIIGSSCFQYQVDDVHMSKKFVFRYDYDLELAKTGHPIAHLQLNGSLSEKVTNSTLESIKFPVLQPTVESVLRLLINHFGVTPNNKADWRRALKYSEDAFLKHGIPRLIAARI